MKAMKTLVRPISLAVALASPTVPAGLYATANAQSVPAPAAQATPAAAAVWSRPAARELLTYIEGLEREGLTPAAYSPDRLRAAVEAGNGATATQLADEIFLRLARDLSGGSVRGSDR